MADFNVRVVGSANLKALTGPFAQFQAQIDALNAELAKMVALQKGVDPAGYERMAKAAALNSKTFRSAAASTGMFEVEQLKLNRATDEYIKKLNARKLSFRDQIRQMGVMKKAYREQLAMENAMLSTHGTGAVGGKTMATSIIPRQVSSELDTAGKRFAYFNEHVKSGARQMINWGKNTQWAGRQLTVGFTMPLAAAGAVAGVLAYNVDKQLTRITKVYDTMANQMSTNDKDQMAVAKELGQVRKDSFATAVDAAKQYGAAVTDTLDVAAELAATGKQGSELQRATSETVRIATLGEIDYQTALQSTISLQSVFKMNSDQLTKSFNYMNAIENATSLTTSDFAQAIPIASGVVKEFGGNVQELGILLTAMKEKGIAATQGANAIKAAMQRLGRPSKQVAEEFAALTGADIHQIFDQSTSLLDLFSRLNDVTKNLDNKDRIKVFAGLFGSYQVTRMRALVEGMGELHDTTTQVGKAYQIAGESSKTWAGIAQRELEQVQNSISGKFKRAVESFKAEISTMGGPFVQVATLIITSLAGVMDGFNRLPKVVKGGIAIMLGMVAVSGILIMLTGLFANLIGNAITFGAAVAGLAVKTKFLDRETWAATKAAEMADRGYVSNRRNAELLTLGLAKLSRAQIEANQAMMSMGVKVTAGATGKKPAQRIPAGQPGAGRFASSDQMAMVAMSRATAETEQSLEKSGRAAKVMAAGGALFTASMITSMVSSNKIVDDIANYVMIASLAVPLIVSMGRGMMKFVAAQRAAAAAAVGVEAATAATTLSVAGIGRGIGAAAMAFDAFMGPVGWTLAAVGAIGFGIWKWKEHMDAVRKEQERVQESVMNLTDSWAKGVGKVQKSYEDMKVAQNDVVNQQEKQSLYSEYTTGDMKGVTADFKATPAGSAERDDAALKHFLDLQVKYGLSVEQAHRQVVALYEAIGYGAGDAEKKVNDLTKSYGDLADQANLTQYLAAKIDIFKHMVPNSASAKKAAQDVADAFTRAYANATPDQAKELTQMLQTSIGDAYVKALDGLEASSPAAAEKLGKMTGQQIMDGIKQAGSIDKFLQDQLGQQDFMQIPIGALAQFKTAIGQAQDAEGMFVSDIVNGSSAIGVALGSNIKTLDDFTNTWLIKSKQWTIDQASTHIDKLSSQMRYLQKLSDMPGSGVSTEYVKAEKESYKVLINQENLNHGFKEGATYAEALRNWIHQIPADLQASGMNIQQANAASQTWLSTIDDIAGKLSSLAKNSMQGVQQDISDMVSSQFDTQMNAALDKRQAYWDAREKNLAAAMDRRSKGLDEAWARKKDAAEKYWDARIQKVKDLADAEQKAEDARQKMFEAEIARITRLNDLANKNIDFNVALNTGNLDEAAKIRNDSAAEEAQFALNRAAEAGAKKSQKRIDKLNDRADALQKQKDAFMKNLDKQEQAEKDHLSKVTQMREDALKKQADADIAAQKAEWDRRKQTLDDELTLFMSYIATNKSDLKKHMSEVGLSYDQFGKELQAKGETWSTFLQESLTKHIREGAEAMRSDAVWASLGQQTADEVLKGMGFENMAQFKTFVETGQMIHEGHSFGDDQGHQGGHTARHAGGPIGSGGSDRLGRHGALRPDEQMIVAQKGEYMLDKDTYAKNKDAVHAIHSGRFGTDFGTGGISGGTTVNPGLAGMLAGVANQLLAKGAAAALGNVYKAAKQRAAGMMAYGNATPNGPFGSAGPGVYGGREFGPMQLSNAKVIADVGRNMGMSARDIEIGIMTAITESGLVNIHGGDRDSAGLFQQRPSQGWGTLAQVTDPNYAANKFFSALRGVTDRDAMVPWMVAQAVQRSAYADGSNYQPYWDDAQGIFNAMQQQAQSGGPNPGGTFIAGPGGRHRPTIAGPVVQGIHDDNAIDIGVPIGSPVYAIADGRVTGSYDIRGYEPRRMVGGVMGPTVQDGFRSYGRVITMDHGAFSSLYAHLSNRGVGLGAQVPGGSRIGTSGNAGYVISHTGNGAHLHFGTPGANPYSFLSLRKGASEVRWDNTIANLHHGEAVLTKDLNSKMHEGIERFANGPESHYTANVTVIGSEVDNIDQLADKVVNKLKQMERRKPQSRRG